jgi:hypothetical protein
LRNVQKGSHPVIVATDVATPTKKSNTALLSKQRADNLSKERMLVNKDELPEQYLVCAPINTPSFLLGNISFGVFSLSN